MKSNPSIKWIRVSVMFSLFVSGFVRPGVTDPFDYRFDGTLQVTGPNGPGGGTPPPPGPYPPPPPPPAPPPPAPSDGLTFKWTVDGVEKPAPAFVPAPGPGGNAGNLVSRLQLTNEISLVIWRRFSPSTNVSLVEVGIFNDPQICSTQPGAGGTIPSVTMPDIGIFCFNGKMYPLTPNESTWIPVSFGDSYYMNFGNPDWRKFCDGAGNVSPFIVTTNMSGPQPTLNDLKSLFPPNPGSMWTTVDPNFPSHTPGQINAVVNGSLPFDNSGDPWVLQGMDEKPVGQAGFHGDWPWCQVGAFYTKNDVNDLFWIMPTVYRQAARQMHFYGFNSNSAPLGKYMFNLSRPAIWGTDFLGRVPTGASPFYIAPQADNHGWTGPDHEHASDRRLGEYAESTGSPFAWQEVLHYGQLVKPMLRSIDPQGGFPDSTRAYLAWLEVAYRCYRLDSSFDMTYAMEAIERWLDRSRSIDWDGSGPFVPGWGKPQPFNMITADSWFPGTPAAASFEDMRFIPILLKVGELFNRPKMIQAALEGVEWYSTIGWSDGTGQYPVGVKVIVAIDGKAVGLGSPPADLVGYARADGLGFYLAGKYLQAHPNPLFNGALYLQHAKEIKDASVTQPNYQPDLAGYLPWISY